MQVGNVPAITRRYWAAIDTLVLGEHRRSAHGRHHIGRLTRESAWPSSRVAAEHDSHSFHARQHCSVLAASEQRESRGRALIQSPSERNYLGRLKNSLSAEICQC